MILSERSKCPNQSKKGVLESLQSPKSRCSSPSFVFRRMVAGNGLFYPILGFVSCVVFIYMSFGDLRPSLRKEVNMSFVKRNGTQFMLDGRPFYINGWNSYWFMVQSVDESSRHRIRDMLQTGANMGLTVCRTWAFNDGDYNALQISPGRFDERVFQALDYVIAEARQHGIRLLLALVNNLHAYGGKTQYVKWAWEEGIGLSSSNDSFFYDPSIRSYFKSYVKTVLTRKNTITGVEYRNDPTILGWELINEPRCMTDPSGDTLQDWLEEMSAFVKLIDKNHLVTIGLEGFYGPNDPKGPTVNPEEWASRLGSDFIRNSGIANIDFTSVHIYPDHWLKTYDFEVNLRFVVKWIQSHIEDGDKTLNKPVLFSEYGWSDLIKNFSVADRERMYRTILDMMYKSAKKSRAGAGALVWQFLVEGMNDHEDDFWMIPRKGSSIYSLFLEHSCRLSKVIGWTAQQDRSFKEACKKS